MSWFGFLGPLVPFLELVERRDFSERMLSKYELVLA